MSAVAEQVIDPAEVRMPGYMAGTVSDYDDEALQEERASSFRHIAVTLEQDGLKPTDDGFAPEHWLAHCREHRAKHNNLSSVERAQRRILAIGQELERREAER